MKLRFNQQNCGFNHSTRIGFFEDHAALCQNIYSHEKNSLIQLSLSLSLSLSLKTKNKKQKPRKYIFTKHLKLSKYTIRKIAFGEKNGKNKLNRL